MQHTGKILKVQPITAILILSACAKNVTDEGFEPSCQSVVVDTLSSSEDWSTNGFSAEDVVASIHAIADTPGTLANSGDTVEMNLAFTPSLLDGAVEVVELSGDDSCMQGTYLSLGVSFAIEGSIDGYQVEDSMGATVFAQGVNPTQIFGGPAPANYTYPGQVIDEDLLLKLHPYADPNQFWGDPMTWQWSIGLNFSSTNWEKAMQQGGVGVTAVTDVDGETANGTFSALGFSATPIAPL